MSKDIRSYFFSAKAPPKQNGTDSEKPRKKAKAIVTSDDEDEDKSKGKKANDTKTKTGRDKGHHTKKRAILSSDEDEAAEAAAASRTKSKKAKLGKATDDDECVEIIQEVGKVFDKKPLKRVNAVKVAKKIEEPVKKAASKVVDFAAEDDDFDATLNQLDTSHIEDEYLSSIGKEKTSSFFDDKAEGGSSSKEKEKKVDKEKSKKSPSPVKSKTKEKDKKQDAGKEKKKKDQAHPNLEVEKEPKAHKPPSKPKDVDYNELIQEKVEKKKQNALLYQSYLNRGGARNPGSKEIPEAADNCLHNLSFLITGVLDSLEREEADEIIKKYGGKILHSVSKKLSYILVGDQPGPSKMAKAESLGCKKITENDFLELLRTLPAGPGSKTTSGDNNKRKRENGVSHEEHKSPEKVRRVEEPASKDPPEKVKEKSPSKDQQKSPEKKQEKSPPKDQQKSPEKKEEESVPKASPKQVERTEEPSSKAEAKKDTASSQSSTTSTLRTESQPTSSQSSASDKPVGTDHISALVEKYRPKEMKQIIGQTGDKSNAKKLQNWLVNWNKHHSKTSNAPKPKYPGRDDTGAMYRAALLSGPPGIGKTTTAYVICAQLGYEVLEFNASDTRSKKLLQEEIAGIFLFFILLRSTAMPFYIDLYYI